MFRRVQVSIVSISLMLVGSMAHTKNVSHPLNLKKTHEVNCITPNQLQPKYTPADLHGAIIKCIKKKKLEEARFLFMAYSFYGGFDRRRITDRSAAGAISSLNFMFSEELSKRKLNQFFEFLNELRLQDELLQEICDKIEEVGWPTYVPYYMLGHGLRSFKTSGDQVTYLSKAELKELISKKDGASVWKQTLTENGCS